eukprot:72978-Pleurochrysis_carterae.AAC.1
MRSLTALGRTHFGTRPSLPSQRPASFAIRNLDIWSQTQGRGLFSTPLSDEPALHPCPQDEEVEH